MTFRSSSYFCFLVAFVFKKPLEKEYHALIAVVKCSNSALNFVYNIGTLAILATSLYSFFLFLLSVWLEKASPMLEGSGASYYDRVVIFEGTALRDFLLQVFYESSSHRPPIILLDPFQNFKTYEDVLSSRCTSGIKDNGGKVTTACY